jgi:hypothetical protein
MLFGTQLVVWCTMFVINSKFGKFFFEAHLSECTETSLKFFFFFASRITGMNIGVLNILIYILLTEYNPSLI